VSLIYLLGILNSEMEMLDFAFTTFTDKNISAHLTHMRRERES